MQSRQKVLIPLCVSLLAGSAAAHASGGGRCEPSWDVAIGSPGLNDSPLVLYVYDDGSGPALFAGGWFTDAGGIWAGRVAKWDGTAWWPVGAAFDSSVTVMASFDDGTGEALYVGGLFQDSGGTQARRIARWDGTQWTEVGGGADGYVGALAVYNDGTGAALYAGGEFANIGGIPANAVARWDGSNWSAVGTGVSSAFGIASVESMLVWDDGSGAAVYVGGLFGQAGGQTAGGIARWNGTAWSTLGTGISAFAHLMTMAVFDDGSGPKLHTGGAMGMHRWTGSEWVRPSTGGYVNALAVFDDRSGPQLYLAGSFTSAGGVPASRIARWDGSTFTALGSGLDGPGYVLAQFGDDLHVGGSFGFAGGLGAGNIATWTGCPGAGPCYANCDGSTVEPVLTVDDFTCFINKFAAAQSLPHEEQITHYANCDGSTTAPVLNVDDFTCFINAFAAGCP